MSIIEKIFSAFAEKVMAPKVENTVASFVDKNILDKNIESTIFEYLLQTYGNELFYNDLCGYILRNNVIGYLIDSVRRKSTIQPNYRTGFISENEKRFLSQHPKYAFEPIQRSQISNVLGEIFDVISSRINILNPHSDIGKLQNTIVQAENEHRFRDDQSRALLAENVKKLDLIYQRLVPQQSIADSTKQDLINCSEEITAFTEEIKKIESEYQQKWHMDEALLKYYELLQSITSKLHNQPEKQVDTLICSLYCNIALCQSNLGDAKKAFKSMEAISKTASENSKIYHFVYASIIIQHTLSSQYGVAERHLDRALEIDNTYHRAFLLRQYLYALTEKADCANIIKSLNDHFAPLLAENKDRGLIADFYMQRGLIYQVYRDPFSSEEDFKCVLSYSDNTVVANFNILAAEYGQATIELPQNRRILFPQIDTRKMLHVKTELEKYLTIETFESSTIFPIKNNALSLYVSACTLLGCPHNLSPLDTYLPFASDYETKRALILGYRGNLTEEQISQLEDPDREFLHISALVNDGKFLECKDELVEKADKRSKPISAPLLSTLLQVCLILKNPEEYRKYRDLAVSNGMHELPLDAYDAYAYELDGDILQSKALLDKIATTSSDYPILENALRFYKRNKFLAECEELYLRVQNLYKNNAIVINDIESFYQEAMHFLVTNNSHITEEFFNKIDKSDLQEKCYYSIKASFCSATNNVIQLLDSLDFLYTATQSFTDGFNKALCQRWLQNYDESLEESLKLLNKVSNEDEKVKTYWLISDLYLLKGDMDTSFEWAKKAHDLKAQNPFDQSHPAFFTRAVRSGHYEGLATTLEYKKIHPVVIDWIQEFSINTSENPIESISRELDKQFPNWKKHQEAENQLAAQYKKGIIPINVLLNFYNNDWSLLLRFAEDNKLKISYGSVDRLQEEYTHIGEHLVVDAQTLIFLAFFDCLPALQCVKYLHITFSSVATLQYQYLSRNYAQINSLMKWFQSSDNIIFEADGFVKESKILDIFSRDFVAGCNVAHEKNIPFLFSDISAFQLQNIPDGGIPPDIVFISIPALCKRFGLEHKSQKNRMIYELLKGCTFISFDADAILEQICIHEFNVSEDYLVPFLICKTDYDMESFAIVYLQAIARLNKIHSDAAISLAKVILDDTARIWRRGTYYRETARYNNDRNALDRSKRISKYVVNILQGIKKIFNGTEEAWPQYIILRNYFK